MIRFYLSDGFYYVVDFANEPSETDFSKLLWLFEGAQLLEDLELKGLFIGPHKEIITPWGTNAVEICQNMGITTVSRIEIFYPYRDGQTEYDPMLQRVYENIGQDIFTLDRTPEDVYYVDDIEAYNQQYGLALSKNEIKYLELLQHKIGRKLTDVEIYGFAQVNSEHCRHKIFRGSFTLDGILQDKSLFEMIQETTASHPQHVVSAYKDNVAFLKGSTGKIFTPQFQDRASYFIEREEEFLFTLKAETHNFPTTVEPFYGASTGSGGEIRDRMAGGQGSIPLAGTAVYCTSYPRHKIILPSWIKKIPERQWLYQTPSQILVKASNGASDFGNKFGQPLICGSVLTFEHEEEGQLWAYDKVIMLAGGVGIGLKKYSHKQRGRVGDYVIMLGGDNYRIGMGGGSVSSVNTGELEKTIELSAVQRANPEMQKRVFNVIRAMVEDTYNPILSIHDHGAGGHLNCFAELLEQTGGEIEIDRLPVGDPTLSEKEIICNESQERMGLLLRPAHYEYVRRVAVRERAPIYCVGKVTGNKTLTFKGKGKIQPFDLKINFLFGHPPRINVHDVKVYRKYKEPEYNLRSFNNYLRDVLRLESVGCKDWLTNKVDRSVTGRIALQQCAGLLQLPLNNLGVATYDYTGTRGVATSIGMAPVVSLIDAGAASRLAVAEALTNLVWAPLTCGLQGVALSANWMWASDHPGEAYRLYEAVKALSEFAIELGIPVPTGKDSLFMSQKYPDGTKVVAPGTVIVSAAAETDNIHQIIQPVLKPDYFSTLIFIRFTQSGFELGGSAFYQSLGYVGTRAPLISDARYFAKAFNTVQKLIRRGYVLAGHDVSSGGLITTLLEMCFAEPSVGLDVNISSIEEIDIIKILFSEAPGVVIQVNDPKPVIDELIRKGLDFYVIGRVIKERVLKIVKNVQYEFFDINYWRDVWYAPSYLMDRLQSGHAHAKLRYHNYKSQPLQLKFPENFDGFYDQQQYHSKRKHVRAAIIREKGVNGDREMAYALYHAGFAVKDVHMTDLITGAETLEDVHMIVFVGGFSNSDVLGSAKGWAGAFLYNDQARQVLEKFYQRDDTLSLGVCNGCQLMMELGLITPFDVKKPKLLVNDSGKFESAFLSVEILPSSCIMLKPLEGSRLGIWIAHGQGKFWFPYLENHYQIPMKYVYDEYPGNPNGSEYQAAAVCSADGRHLAMMPHIERSVFPWQWGYYPWEYKKHQVSPWFLAFRAAYEWIERKVVSK